MRILDRCRRDFDEFELKAIRKFIDEHGEPPGVLSIQIQRCLSILSLVEAESGSLAAMEMERKEKEAAIEDQASANAERKAAKEHP
jgi:hypothetical protein